MIKIYKYQETTWINNVKDLLLSCLFFFFFYRNNHFFLRKLVIFSEVKYNTLNARYCTTEPASQANTNARLVYSINMGKKVASENMLLLKLKISYCLVYISETFFKYTV